MGQSSDCFVLPLLARYCRLRQGQDICARHGLSELMNGRTRTGNEGEKFIWIPPMQPTGLGTIWP